MRKSPCEEIDDGRRGQFYDQRENKEIELLARLPKLNTLCINSQDIAGASLPSLSKLKSLESSVLSGTTFHANDVKAKSFDVVDDVGLSIFGVTESAPRLL